MADKAHVLTDKEIEKMERHLSAIYSRAEKELSEKADKYFEKFRKRDEKMRELLDAGKIDRKEYDTWRRNQLMTGRHWTEMKRQAAHRLTQADQEAAEYINGRLPSVYALNYNAVSDGLETRVKGYSFELVDANTVKNLATQDKTLLPYKYIDGAKAERWHTQRVNAEVLQGILQGESIPKIAKRLRDNVGMSARGSAVRNARTAVTSAENKGRMDMLHDAEEKGVKAEKGWLAAHDARVRESHAQVDGEFVGIDDEFSNGLQFPGDPDGRPEEVYNCFIGETNIASDSEIVRSYKHEYSGKLVTVKTAGGVNFTCTPNHPILTIDGWVKAESLQNGDNLIVTFGQKNLSLRINPDVNHAFPRIDAIHEFLDKMGGERTCSLSVDFHGDIPTSDVEIITEKGFLRKGGDPGAFNSINKFLLKHTNKSFLRYSTFVEHFGRVCKSALCIVGGFSKALPLIWRSLRHSEIHRFRPIALLYSGRVKPLDNDAARNAKLIGECLDGFSGAVFADNIVSVDFSSGSSHVYNLQTENGYYFVNSSIAQNKQKGNGIFAIAHNCRCTLVYKVVGFGNQVATEETKLETVEEFIPATSVKEAEEYISQFVDTSIFGATGVDYTGVDLEAANEVNRVLSHLQKTFDVGKFGGITAPAGNTKAGKMISGAQAAYSPIRKSYYLNRKTFKSVSAAEKAFKAETEAIMGILEHPERYDFSKASSALLRVIENSKISGRATIPTTIEQCLQHEFGHSLEKRVMSHELWSSAAENMVEFAPKISGYACQDKSEYIAESFCSFMQGEKRADPVLVKIFESLKR